MVEQHNSVTKRAPGSLGLRRQVAILCGASWVALALPMAAASAQQQQQQQTAQRGMLDEVVVTAQRREDSIQDVPISVTAFSSEEITLANIKGVDDFFYRTPNVSFTQGGSRDRRELSIRGVTNQVSRDYDVRPDSFGFYIDEFNVVQGTVNPPILDMERIEVLRGPQGTAFGRNAVGGAINLVTRKPDNDFFMENSIGYERFNTIDVQSILNIPLIEDTLAVRFAGNYRETDGHIRNINVIGGGNDSKYQYLRGTVRWTPTDRFTLDVQGTFVNEEVGMREGVPSGVMSPFGSFLFGPEANPDGVGFYPENRSRVNFNRGQNVGNEFYYVMARAQYDWDDLSLISITGYIDKDEFLVGDIDGGSIDAFYETKPLFRTSFTQELRLVSSLDGRFNWSGGVIFARDRGSQDQFTFAGNEAPLGLQPDQQVTSSGSEGEMKSYAAYGEIFYDLTDRLQLKLGARLSREEVDQLTFRTSGDPPVITAFADGSTKYTDFSPSMSLTYNITDDVSVYGTVSRAYKSGGVQTNIALAEEGEREDFDEEVLWNYEIGLKSELFDRRLRLNAAAFYMDWEDMQVNSAAGVLTPGGDISFLSAILNAAEARNYGFELDGQALVTDSLVVGFGLGYLNAKFDNFEDAFVEGQFVDLSGRVIPNSPRWTANVNAQQNFELGNGREAYIRGEVFGRSSNQSSINALVFGGFPYEVAGFGQFNLRGGIQTERWDVTAFVENVFDNNYYTNAYQKAFYSGLHVVPSFRNWGIRLTVRL